MFEIFVLPIIDLNSMFKQGENIVYKKHKKTDIFVPPILDITVM